jgi:hypothetical protein
MTAMFTSIFDNFSYQPHLFYKGHERFKSKFIAFLGLTLYILMLILCIFFYVESRDKYQINISENKDIYPILNLTNTFISIYLSNGLNSIDDPAIFSFRAMFFKYYYETNQSSSLSLQFKEYPFEKCKDINFSNYGLKNITDENTFCLKPNTYDLALLGPYGDTKGYSYLNIFLNRCANSTNSKVVCKPVEIIESYLKNVYTILTLQSNMIDHSLKYPFIGILETLAFPFSSSIFKRYFTKLTNVIYETDFGQVFEDKNKDNGYIYGNYDLNVDLKVGAVANPSALGQITISCDNKTLLYNRSYTKLQTVMANVGGTLKFLQTLISLLAYNLTKKRYFEEIINLVYYYKTSKSESNKKIVSHEANIRTSDYKIKYETIKIKKYNKDSLKFKLRKSEVLCPLFTWRKSRMNFYKMAESKLQEKLSYSNLCLKLLQFEILKNILFNDKQLKYFNSIQRINPHFNGKPEIINHITEDDLNDDLIKKIAILSKKII